MVESELNQQKLNEKEVIDVQKHVVEFEDMLEPDPEDDVKEFADQKMMYNKLQVKSGVILYICVLLWKKLNTSELHFVIINWTTFGSILI